MQFGVLGTTPGSSHEQRCSCFLLLSCLSKPIFMHMVNLSSLKMKRHLGYCFKKKAAGVESRMSLVGTEGCVFENSDRMLDFVSVLG